MDAAMRQFFFHDAPDSREVALLHAVIYTFNTPVPLPTFALRSYGGRVAWSLIVL